MTDITSERPLAMPSTEDRILKFKNFLRTEYLIPTWVNFTFDTRTQDRDFFDHEDFVRGLEFPHLTIPETGVEESVEVVARSAGLAVIRQVIITEQTPQRELLFVSYMGTVDTQLQ